MYKEGAWSQAEFWFLASASSTASMKRKPVHDRQTGPMTRV